MEYDEQSPEHHHHNPRRFNQSYKNIECIQICLSGVTVLLLLFVVLVIGYLGFAFIKYQNIFIDMLHFD
jgi:hypothetical protein